MQRGVLLGSVCIELAEPDSKRHILAQDTYLACQAGQNADWGCRLVRLVRRFHVPKLNFSS